MDLGGDDLRGSIGHVYAMSGKRGEAAKLLSQLEEEGKQKYVSPYNFAVIYAGLGEKDQAFAFLEKAYSARDSNLVTSKWTRNLAPSTLIRDSQTYYGASDYQCSSSP